jgi:hypothetical protein
MDLLDNTYTYDLQNSVKRKIDSESFLMIVTSKHTEIAIQICV